MGKNKLHDGKITYFLRNVPEETYRKFQTIAKSRGLTIRSQLITLMEDFTNEKKKEH